MEGLLHRRDHVAAKHDADGHPLRTILGVHVTGRCEEDLLNARVVEELQYLVRRDGSGESLGVRVDDVQVAVRIFLARVLEAEGRKVQGPGLPAGLDPRDPRFTSDDCIEPPAS